MQASLGQLKACAKTATLRVAWNMAKGTLVEHVQASSPGCLPHKRQDKKYGLRRSAFQLPLPLGEGWGEGAFVPAKGLGDPHPSPLPEGEGTEYVLCMTST